MPAVLSARLRSLSSSRRSRPAAERTEAADDARAAPATARSPVTRARSSRRSRVRIQPAVVAPPADAPAVVAQGSVVDEPSEAALRLIQKKFSPFHAVRTPVNTFVVHRKIGQGMWSAVFQVEDRQQEMFFALKVVPLGEPFVEAVVGTAALLRRLKHKHIVHCFEHFKYVTKGVPFYCSKLQACLGGSMADLIRSRGCTLGRISDPYILGYVTQLASALEYLHNQGLLHGDLRPDNVLLATDTEVRLAGLTHQIGLRRRAPGAVTVTGGHRLYAPPEWAGSPFRGRALHATEVPLPSYDMWGLGCLLVELCTGKLLEDRLGLTNSPLALDAAAMEAVRLQMRSAHKGAFAQLAQRLLDADPDTRLSAEDMQDALQVAATRITSWSDVIVRPLRLLKVSRH
eukprot:EG_transcript_8690